MDKKQRKKSVSFKQPLTEDRYKEELIEDVELTPEVEEELRRIGQCYKMKLPSTRVSAWRQFQQSQTVEVDESIQRSTEPVETAPLARTRHAALVPVIAPIPIGSKLSDIETWLQQKTLEQLLKCAPEELIRNNAALQSDFEFLRPSLESAIGAPVQEAAAYLLRRTFQRYTSNQSRAGLQLYISSEFCIALLFDPGSSALLNYIAFANL